MYCLPSFEIRYARANRDVSKAMAKPEIRYPKENSDDLADGLLLLRVRFGATRIKATPVIDFLIWFY